MDFNNYAIILESNILNNEVKEFIETYHYKGTARSLKPRFVFSLFYEDLRVGVALFGDLCHSGAERLYGRDSLELRRFVLLDCAPKNSESFFLSKCLKYIKKQGIKSIVSYADANKGHEGTIYKASNFTYAGLEKYRVQVLRYRGRDISMRQVYQKSKITKTYVESAIKYQQLKAEGKAKAVLTKPKHIYIYNFDNRQNKQAA